MLLGKKRGTVFVNVVAIIGAVLIFVGIAWMIAKNWHQIPNVVKVIILVVSTLLAFGIGVILRLRDNEGTGRALITLGALLYILSLFLISQIYHLATEMQHYAWLLFMAWTIIFITAYFLDSRENLTLSMLVFFPWVVLQYMASVSKQNLSTHGGIIFGFVLIFLSAGVLIYGLSVLHNSLQHRFTNIYRFWTVFYFLLIFYIISFQTLLPILSEYSFEGKAFTAFLVIFIILCFFGFVIGALLATSRSSTSIIEILGFIAVLAILFSLILATKVGAGTIGTCYEKRCNDFKTADACGNVPSPLLCEWKLGEGRSRDRCIEVYCHNFKTETECNSAPDQLNCNWDGSCRSQGQIITTSQECRNYQNKKEECTSRPACKWTPSYSAWRISKGLPTSLWLLWMLINFVLIGFIILVMWYGQKVGSAKIVNIALLFFILQIITRYIGFWMDLRGYVAFSILAIIGGILLIAGSILIPKWRRAMLERTKRTR